MRLRLSVFLILFLIFRQLACSQDTDIVVNGNFRGIPLISAFNYLETNYPLRFYYKEEWFVNDTAKVNIENQPIGEATRILLNGRPFTYRIIQGNQIVILPREEVAMLAGHIQNYSDNDVSDQAFILVGNVEDFGKQKAVILNGQIKDGKTGDPVIGAVIQVNNLQQGVVSNAEGRYKLTIAPGLYTLMVSSVGFEKNYYQVKIVGNGVLDMELFDKSIALDDIVIYGERVDKNISSHQMSLVELDNRSIKQLPSVAGGKDILKGLTTMPGVKSIGEFSSGINVRGGGEDQNLYLFNGAPLFNTSHVFGLFSVINPDVVDKLSLYKGHIPALHGERVSSVVDIRTSESAPDRVRIKGGIGLYDGKLMAEVPLYKDKVFFDAGGRTSYSNWMLQRMKDYNLRNSLATFYDLNGSLHALLPKGRISISGYTSFDEFKFASEVKYKYGSTLGSLNWSYPISSNLGSYLSISYSKYNVEKEDISTHLMQSRTDSEITYKGLKYRVKFGGINRHTLDAGFSLVKYDIMPGKQEPLNDYSMVLSSQLESEEAYEGAVFINDEYNLGLNLTFNTGIRVSGYSNPETPKEFRFEPRLSAKFRLNDFSSVKVSYNRNFQYLSMISYSSVSTPADIWKLSDSYIRPLEANQFALGYYRNFLNNSIETSVEIYYKGLNHVIEYKDGANLEMNPDLRNELIDASGRNYGVEFLLKKNSGKVDGWISYTYSRSLRRTSGMQAGEMINGNNWFPSSYDRPHDVTVVSNLHLNKRLQLSANFTYASGRPITLPEYKYFADDEVVVYFSDRNEYRIPPYHRLDITLSFDESLRIKKKWKGRWSFSILNVYGRRNAYTVYYKKEDPSELNDYNRFSLYKLYLIGRPLPTVSYLFMF
ncbi:MAG: TonB-dependent receptor [Bacteroidales bacterium]|nr:TonB-dependent receptor [Bacteroidales bacterium]